MTHIAIVSADTSCDFDYGEGWLTLCWNTEIGLDASLTIDFEGHCSREMPIRSGTGVTIVSVSRNSVVLNFTPELANKLQLDEDIEFTGELSDEFCADAGRLASLF